MSSTYFIWQISFQTRYHKRVRYCIHMSEHSTRRPMKMSLKISNSGEMCTSDGWMYVYIFICYRCVYVKVYACKELRWCESDLLPVGKHLREHSGGRTNTTATMLRKYPNYIREPKPRWKFGCPIFMEKYERTVNVCMSYSKFNCF